MFGGRMFKSLSKRTRTCAEGKRKVNVQKVRIGLVTFGFNIVGRGWETHFMKQSIENDLQYTGYLKTLLIIGYCLLRMSDMMLTSIDICHLTYFPHE